MELGCYQNAMGSEESLEDYRCSKCGNFCIIKESFDFSSCKTMYQAGCDLCEIFTDWTVKKEEALNQLKNGEACRREVDLLVFPSDYFDSSSVDADMRKEYEAAMEAFPVCPTGRMPGRSTERSEQHSDREKLKD